MCSVVLTLNSTDFYKSMTIHSDHRIWQDVYRTTIANGADVYIKLTVMGDVLIVSFKEL
jgi:motility quorum-sensing regulator/GCU-specific mRNA interferase toxin